MQMLCLLEIEGHFVARVYDHGVAFPVQDNPAGIFVTLGHRDAVLIQI